MRPPRSWNDECQLRIVDALHELGDEDLQRVARRRRRPGARWQAIQSEAGAASVMLRVDAAHLDHDVFRRGAVRRRECTAVAASIALQAMR